MMKYRITTGNSPITLKVVIKTDAPKKVRLRVYDEENPNRVFTDRYKTIKDQEELFVRMPLSPNKAIVEVTPKDINVKGKDSGIELVSVDKVPLERRIDLGDISNPQIKSFVEFAQRFSFNIDELEPDTYYTSSDREYYIQLLPKILNSKGEEMNTPARVSKRTGIIQVSKKSFDKMTIPMRLAILLHEFSHFYLNETMDDEVEADLNGLLIYLGLGYPRIEAYQSFLETFKGVPSEQNKNRYDVINKFINEFESMNMLIK